METDDSVDFQLVQALTEVTLQALQKVIPFPQRGLRPDTGR